MTASDEAGLLRRHNPLARMAGHKLAAGAPAGEFPRASGGRLRSKLGDLGDWYRLLGATFYW